MQNTKIAAKAAQKKAYVRPELTKHGKVESLTQGLQVQSGCSHPFNAPSID